MAERKPEWREAGDLLIYTVKAVTDLDITLLEGKNNWSGNFANA